nr:hypothetical protein Iba_chr09bCG0700 [Ipomoea batatas]
MIAFVCERVIPDRCSGVLFLSVKVAACVLRVLRKSIGRAAFTKKKIIRLRSDQRSCGTSVQYKKYECPKSIKSSLVSGNDAIASPSCALEIHDARTPKDQFNVRCGPAYITHYKTAYIIKLQDSMQKAVISISLSASPSSSRDQPDGKAVEVLSTEIPPAARVPRVRPESGNDDDRRAYCVLRPEASLSRFPLRQRGLGAKPDGVECGVSQFHPSAPAASE